MSVLCETEVDIELPVCVKVSEWQRF